MSASVAPVSMSARVRIGGGASARFLAPSARARGAALARSRGVTRAMKAPTVRAAATEVRGDAIKIDVRAREVAIARARSRAGGRARMDVDSRNPEEEGGGRVLFYPRASRNGGGRAVVGRVVSREIV